MRLKRNSNKSKATVSISKWKKCIFKKGIKKNSKVITIMKNPCHLLKKENFNKTDKSEENNNKNSLLPCNLKSKKLNPQLINTTPQLKHKYLQSKKT